MTTTRLRSADSGAAGAERLVRICGIEHWLSPQLTQVLQRLVIAQEQTPGRFFGRRRLLGPDAYRLVRALQEELARAGLDPELIEFDNYGGVRLASRLCEEFSQEVTRG